jgi:hypothetical protein
MRCAACVFLLFATPLLAQDVTARRIDVGAPVHRLRFLESDRLLVFAGDVIEYDWRFGAMTKRHPMPPHANPDCTDFSPDGSTAAICDGGTITLIDSGTGAVLQDVTHASSRVFPCAFSPDGKSVYFITEGFTCKAWDVAARKVRAQYAHSSNLVVGRVAPSGDGRLLATIINDPAIKSSAVGIWEVRTGVLRSQLPLDGRVKGDLCVSGDSRRVAVLVLNPEQLVAARAKPMHQLSCVVCEVASGNLVRRLQVLPDDTVRLALSGDGTLIACGCRDGTVAVLSVSTGGVLARLRDLGGTIVSLAFSPRKYILAAADENGSIHVWDLLPPSLGPAPSPAVLWAYLARDETAFASMGRLIEKPDAAIALFRERIRPAEPIGEQRLRQLFSDLDDSSYAVRTRAATELRRAAELIRDELDKHAAAPGTSVEARRQLRRLLERIDEPTLDLIVRLRALEVLERMGTPAARALVAEWAAGAPPARFTQEAAATLQRMKSK